MITARHAVNVDGCVIARHLDVGVKVQRALGVGDFTVKLAMAAMLLIPYGALMRYVGTLPTRHPNSASP